MDLYGTVRLALKDKNPELYRQLEKAGTLREFCLERADQIAEAISDMVSNSPQVRKAWSPETKLSIMERAAIANSQQAIALEIALDAYLEFPQDATSPPKSEEI